MALKDLAKTAPSPASDRPTGITCEKYTKGQGKRCAHYLEGGSCAIPSELMCVEWMKANGHEVPAPPRPPASPKPATDLLGNPLPKAPEPKPTPAFTPAPAVQKPNAPVAPAIDVDQLRGFTSEDIVAFKSAGITAQLNTAVGEVWLVPEYTAEPRVELTPEHAALLARVLSLFPGSQVVSIQKHNPQPKDHP